MTLYDAAGLTGAAMFLVAYAGVQANQLDPHGLAALMLNFLGAVLILVSMIGAFNLAAFVLETCWGLIAAVGLVRLALRRR